MGEVTLIDFALLEHFRFWNCIEFEGCLTEWLQGSAE
jgi:hypothetical protein